MSAQFPFENTYAKLPDRFFARIAPTRVAGPRLIQLNRALAVELGLDSEWLMGPEALEILAGNRVPDAADPIATAYAGHQFGNDPEKHRDFSAVTHVAKDRGIPPFLILHVADHPDTTAQARRLDATLKEAGIPVKVFGAKETTHSKLNDDLGLADDPATKELFAFVDGALKP